MTASGFLPLCVYAQKQNLLEQYSHLRANIELKYGRRVQDLEYSASENSGSGWTQGRGNGMQQFTGKIRNFGKRQLKNGSCDVAEDEPGGRQLCSNFAASVKKTEE